jgi:ribosome maturation factor RimP
MPTLFFVGGSFLIPPPFEQIQQLAQKVVESEGLELVDLEFKAGQSRNLLRIFIDKDGGVTLDDCENVSRQIGALLDVHDLVKNAYVLEVSSPGIDRPFRTDRDYNRSLGRSVKINYQDELGNPLQVTGKLLEAAEDTVTVEAEGELVRIIRDRIRKAQQDIPKPAHPKYARKKRK